MRTEERKFAPEAIRTLTVKVFCDGHGLAPKEIVRIYAEVNLNSGCLIEGQELEEVFLVGANAHIEKNPNCSLETMRVETQQTKKGHPIHLPGLNS